MNCTDYRLSLDIFKTASQTTLPVKQGDTAYRLCVTITANGTPYRITEGCYARFTAKKPDTNSIDNDCSIENNTIYYELTPQTTAAIGIVECEIVLYDAEGGQLATPHFNILVDKKVYNGEDIKSSSENEVLKSIAENAIRAETARDEAQEYATSAGDAKGEAQGHALSAQDAQQAAEGAKNVAIDSAISASASAFEAETAQQGAKQAEENAKNYADEAKQSAEALSSVNNIFSNALKGSTSGEIIGMHDVSPIEHEMDIRVRGKNILPYPYANTTKIMNGITFTDNGDGSITVEGTATANAYFVLQNKFYLQGSNITLKKSGNDYIPNTNGIYTASKRVFCNTINGSITLELNKGDGFSGYEVFYPQIELGTTATSYAPYVPDISAVKVNKLGKNLVYAPISTIQNGLTITKESDGSLYVKGKAESLTTYFFEIPSGNVFRENTAYRLSLSYSGKAPTNDIYPIITYAKNGQQYWVQNVVWDKNCSNPRCYIQFNADAEVDAHIYPQLEIGSIATEYEPYIEPTEYTVNADGVISGVNSLYPSTTLMTDTDGAVIDTSYNKDINKAFEEIKNAILSLGGNV